MLKATNLKKTFTVDVKKRFYHISKKRQIEAVKDVSLQIESGQIVGLLGVNGAGKSTVIKMLAGILTPTEGTVDIDNLRTEKERKTILNMITGGERNLYWRLTARENLEYFASLYNVPKKESIKRIEEILEVVNLTDVMDITAEKYSKGMKQRLQIARGLINNPKYILLDEPTLGLDISIAKEIRSYIKKLAQVENKGILLTTHYITEAEELCDYIYIIHEGQIIAHGTKDDLRKNVSQGYTFTIISSNFENNEKELFYDYIKELGGQVSIQQNPSSCTIDIVMNENKLIDVISKLNNLRVQIYEVRSVEPSLDQIIMKLISGGKQDDSNSRRNEKTDKE